MIPIPSPLVEFILLGPLKDRGQLQDSPILGDVWVEYRKIPQNLSTCLSLLTVAIRRASLPLRLIQTWIKSRIITPRSRFFRA